MILSPPQLAFLRRMLAGERFKPASPIARAVVGKGAAEISDTKNGKCRYRVLAAGRVAIQEADARQGRVA